ncbi:hypothetical protein [Chryseobacterium sp. MA9]|uniref:hypothetical protein n=1 Tax=Chryseobacterium sp. MA9 TaxID=2966625 RepID=UPI002101E083|nr:hypothetical protein [Chryseobacterium sp. MA9]UTX48879.1 hypothetical protein KIK00_01005 [Chryseobacterium sp. MA9]
MKKLILLLLFSAIFNAQVAIGKTQIDGSGLLDFQTGTTNGIILPRVIDVGTMNAIVPGTLVFDSASSRVKYFNGIWEDLSDKQGNSPVLLPGNDIATTGVIIGAASSAATGVLVLESDTKALILPKVTDPVTNVKSPAAGMICYDPGTQMICVYNGTEWFFWK